MSLFKRFRTLLGNESGNVLAIGAAAMPLVIGGAGLAIDTVQISLAKRELQRAADSAAMAGAYAINQNPSSTGTVRTAYAQNGATRDLQLNNDVPLTGSPVIQNAPSTGSYAGNANAVRVQLTANRNLSFFSFFSSVPATITVEATAAILREGNFCMLSLEDTNATGIAIGGNATIDIGCGMSTNSPSASAITATGSSVVRATPVMAVGGVPASTNLANSTVIPYSPVQVDPFATVPNPTIPVGTPCTTLTLLPSDPALTIGPGPVCFSGATINGTLNIQPNTQVYIDGGTLSFGAQAQVTGTDVNFFLTSSNADSNPSSIATLDMNGGADLDISSPTTGIYAGIIFFEDRRVPIGRTITYNGNASSNINGAMYFSRSYFQFLGTAQTSATCLQVVGRRLEFSGNGTIRNSCPAGSNRNNFQATYVRLVG